ncbi:YrdB family protein [Streptacidiphilus monticola]
MNLLVDVLAFGAELAVYAAAGWWAWTRPGRRGARLGVAVIAVALLALAWGAFAAPRRPAHCTASRVVSSKPAGSAREGWRRSAHSERAADEATVDAAERCSPLGPVVSLDLAGGLRVPMSGGRLLRQLLACGPGCEVAQSAAYGVAAGPEWIRCCRLR